MWLPYLFFSEGTLRNSAYILFDELDAIRESGHFGGEALVNKRVEDLGMVDSAEYFAFLVDHSYKVQRMLDQVLAAGINIRSYNTLASECLNAVFGFKTGWGQTQSHGSHRVERHTISTLESFAAHYDSIFSSTRLEDGRCDKVKAELDALRLFVIENSAPGSTQAVLLASIDEILGLIEQGDVDHAVLSVKLSALIGLLVLFAGAQPDDEMRAKWFDRLKTGAFILGSELFLGLTTDLGSIAIQRALGITQ